MPKSTTTSVNVNINDVLAKPFGLIDDKEHSFADALDHFAKVLGTVPSQKVIRGHQLKLVEIGLFLIELKAQIPGTKQYSAFLAKSDIGQKAKNKWGKNAPTELSKLAILATQHNNVVKFIEDDGTTSLSATGILKAFNAFASKNDLPKAVGSQRSAKSTTSEQPVKADKQTKSETGNPSQSQPVKAESQSGKTDKPVVEQTVKSDSKPSTSAIAEQLVDTINDKLTAYELSDDEKTDVLQKLLSAFGLDFIPASTVDMGNVTVMAKAMNKAKAAS